MDPAMNFSFIYCDIWRWASLGRQKAKYLTMNLYFGPLNHDIELV